MQYLKKLIRKSFFKQYDEALSAYNIVKRMGFQSNLEFENEDIIIVGYPKSGNTWFQHLICGIAYGIDVNGFPQGLVGQLVPTIMRPIFYRRYFSPTYFKSHFLPHPEYRKIVYLVRDGRDALVSYYNFTKAVNQTDDWCHFFHSYPNMRYGMWHDHVEKWLENPYQSEMLIIRYEDLQEQALAEARRLTEFVGIERTSEQLQQAIDNASFDKMREREEKYGHAHTFPRNERFIRRGIIGSYKDEMPAEILDLFMQDAAPTLKKLGYDAD